MSRSRVPRLAVATWVVALAILAVLGVAVAHYLNGSGIGGMSTGSMSMGSMGGTLGSADALTRAGSQTPFEPLFGSALFTAWQLDAVAVAVLVLALATYLTGVALVSMRCPCRWPVRRTVSFAAGLAVCAFATNGSIAVYDQVLFTAHMTGHLALVMVAPALLMFGRPLGLLSASSPPARRERITRVLQGRVASVVFAPPVALAVYAVVIVGSHLTGLMDTIMRNTWAGQLEHLVYVLAGCQFFALVIGDEPLRWRLASPARWLLLAIAMAVDTFVGIVLLQGTQAVALQPSLLHVDALSDTRTGGAIMWFGGDAIMAAIMIGLVIGWLRGVETTPVEQGWLERARLEAFTAHTDPDGRVDAGSDDTPERSLDEDDSARDAYNEWLAKLSRQR